MINKYLIFALTTMLVLTGSKANSQKFYGGIQAGINGSQVNGDHMSGFDKGGLLAGVFIDFPYSQNVFFSMELNYSEKGSRSKDGTMQTAGSWTLFRISYLEVPLLINYRLSEKADLNIGLSYGIKVGHKFIDSFGIEIPTADPTRPHDFEICGGGNYRLGKNFKVSFRAAASFISIEQGKSNPLWAKTNTGMINIVISCAIKYYFLSPK